MKEAYRAIKTELLLNSSSKNPKPEGKVVSNCLFEYVNKGESQKLSVEISELDLQILRKLVKQREESISVYDANSRKDLADLEREQLKYLKELLPLETSLKEIEEGVMKAYPDGYSQKEMGKVIKEMKELFPLANGSDISKIVKKHINNG